MVIWMQRLGLWSLCSLLVAFSSVVAHAQAPTFMLSWGNIGSDPGQLDWPHGVAVDASGNVYVTEARLGRLQVFTTNGVPLRQWGGQGSGDGQFDTPAAVAIDANGNVFVVDNGNCRVQKFTSQGSYLLKFGGRDLGGFPHPIGTFDGPMGVAVDANGDVYVADAGNQRIQKFTNGGTFLRAWNIPGPGGGQAAYPNAIAVAADGGVLILDAANNRVHEFTGNGGFVTQWGSAGGLGSPVCVAVDATGVYVTDRQSPSIKKFDRSGNLLAAWGGSGNGDGQFVSPAGVAVDAAGHVFVVDFAGHRVQKFGDLAIPTTRTTWARVKQLFR